MNRPLLAVVVILLVAAPARAHHLEKQAHDMSAAPAAKAKALPLYTNLGTWHHAVKTKSARAQKYFDQGLRMVYAFNHDEAIAAFAEAERLDSTCAMAPWGIALARPNINLRSIPTAKAYAAIERAEKASSFAPARRIGALASATPRMATATGRSSTRPMPMRCASWRGTIPRIPTRRCCSPRR
jgi:hypothetical protein